MTLSYLSRLLCLCFACFFLVQLLFGLATLLIGSVATRLAEHMKARSAAHLLLVLRWTPFVVAVLIVGSLCVPSYLLLEPEAIVEPVGFGCLTAAVLGVATCAESIVRALRAVRSSCRYAQNCCRHGRRIRLGAQGVSAFVVDVPGPCFSLVGVFRPLIVISCNVLDKLSEDQLEAAVRHENAHRISRDNLKRLFVLLAPGIFPFFHVFKSLEVTWAKFAEWAADDVAVGGRVEHSLSLAEALICVARLSPAPASSALVSSLLDGSSDLIPRIERLLNKARNVNHLSDKFSSLARAATAAVVAAAFVLFVLHVSPSSVHSILEQLID
jgi:Zn-dependent protease with chaperone function